MKVLPFKIPKPENELVRHQVDNLPHFYDKLHQHPEVQLTIILKSEGSLVVGDYIGPFKAGELYLMGSLTPHVFRNTEVYYKQNKGMNAHSESLFFDISLMEKHLAGIHEFEGLCSLLNSWDGCYRVTDPKNYIRKKILSLRTVTGIMRIVHSLEIISQLRDGLLLHRLNSMESVKHYSEREGKRMESLMRFIMEHCHRPITLPEIAEVAHMNKEAFCRFFKERTRKTFTEFLCEVRITRACHLLSQPQLSIGQVATESGFNNLSYFNRVFRDLKKVTPKAYRKAYIAETSESTKAQIDG